MELVGFGVSVLVEGSEVEVGFWLSWIQLSETNIVENLGYSQGWRKKGDITFT